MSGNKRAAPEEFTNNTDAMKCLIMSIVEGNRVDREDNKRMKVEITDLKESNRYLHNQVESLRQDLAIESQYAQEMSNRLDAMQQTVENLLNRGPTERDATRDVLLNLRATREYDLTDIDRLLESSDEEDGWDRELADLFGDESEIETVFASDPADW